MDDLQEQAFNENKRGKATARMSSSDKGVSRGIATCRVEKAGKKKIKITGLLFKEKKSPEPFSECLAVVRGVNS